MTFYMHDPDPNHRFFLYSPEGEGFMFFATAEERDAAAKAEIHTYVDTDNGWFEEVLNVFAGTLTHTVKEKVTATKPADFDQMDEDQQDEFWPHGDEFDEIVDYILEALP